MDKLQKYKITKFIGKGGMGQVFAGVHCETGKTCAIKEINIDDDDEKIARCNKEYELLSLIDHPNIVKAYDFFQENNKLYIVMELVNGISLEDFIQDEVEINLKDRIAIAIQIANALEAINTAGVIHRDIKPANIMIDEEKKQIKILDLGLGKLSDASVQDKLTRTGFIMGTPQYISPEQVNGELYNNSDVFAVALTLYQFFANKKSSPFAGDSVTQTIYNITKLHLPLLITAIPHVKASEKKTYQELSTVLDQALVKSPNVRTQSCKILAAQLSKIYYRLRVKRNYSQSWHASKSLDQKSTITLRRLSQKYGSDFIHSRHDKNKLAKYNPYLWIPAVLIIAFILITYMQKVDIESTTGLDNDVAEITKSENENNIGKLVKQARLFVEQKKYQEASLILSLLDTNTIVYQNETEPLSLFVSLFYQQKWEEAFTLAPQFLKTTKDPLAWFYAVRLFMCLGEFSLAQWYGNILEYEHPEFCRYIEHPAVDIARSKFFEAHTKLSNWEIRLENKNEKDINEAFLRILVLHRLKENGDWTFTTDLVKNNITFGRFVEFYNFTSQDFGGLGNPNQRMLFLQQKYSETLSSSSSHYLKHRVMTLFFSVQNYSYAHNILGKFSQDYHFYTPSYLLMGEFNTANNYHKYNQLPTNKLELHGVLYHCVSGSLQQQKASEGVQYAKFLQRYRPNWHFSYVYYGEALILYQQDSPEAFEHIYNGIKINATKIIQTPWFQRYANTIFRIYSNFPPEKQFEIIADLTWYIFELERVLYQSEISNIDYLTKIRDIPVSMRGLLSMISSIPINIKAKENPSIQEIENYCKYAIAQQDYVLLNKYLKMTDTPMITAIKMLDEQRNKLDLNGLDQIYLLLQEAKKRSSNIDYPHDILYCLQSFRLAKYYQQIGQNEKCVKILQEECESGDLNFTNEIKNILPKKDFSPSVFSIDDYVLATQKSIVKQDYKQAQKYADYAIFLVSLKQMNRETSYNYQQELIKLKSQIERRRNE